MDEQTVEQISYVMSRCKEKIRAVAILDDTLEPLKYQAGLYTRYFLDELTKITDMVDVAVFKKNEDPDIEKQINPEYFPVLALIDSSGKYSGVCFYGFPGGFELEAFILAMYNLSGPGQPLDSDLEKRIKAFDSPINLKLGISLSCNVCPELVQTANRFAILNPQIVAETFDLECFPELMNRFDIPSVPAMVINDSELVFGRKDIKDLLDILELRN